MQQASSLAVIRDALAIFKDFIKKIKAAAETGYIPQELRLFVIETVGKRSEDRNYRIWLLSLFGGLEYGAVPSDFPKYKDIKMLGAIRRLAIELPTLPPRGHIGKYIRDIFFHQYLLEFHQCKRDVITKYLTCGLCVERDRPYDKLTPEQKIECDALTDFLCKDMHHGYFNFLTDIIEKDGVEGLLKRVRRLLRLAEEEKKRLEPTLKSKIDSAAKAVRDHGEGDCGWEVTGPVDAAWAIVCHEVMTHTDPEIKKE